MTLKMGDTVLPLSKYSFCSEIAGTTGCSRVSEVFTGTKEKIRNGINVYILILTINK